MIKKTKNPICKGITAILTAAVLSTLLTGCAKDSSDSSSADNPSNSGNKSGKTTALNVSLDHSYSSEQIKIEDMTGFSNIFNIGDNLLISGYDEKYTDKMYLYHMPDGSSKEVSLSYPSSLDEKTECYAAATFLNAEGNPTFIFHAYSWDEENEENPYQDLGYTLEVYDKDLNVLETKDMSGVFGENTYFNNLTADKNGNYYIVIGDEEGNTNINIYDKDFKQTGEVTGDFQYIDKMFLSSDGKINLSYQDSEWNSCFGTINMDSKSVEKIEIPNAPSWFNGAFSGGQKYDFYIYDATAVYGVNLAEGICEEAVNWLNSDFTGDTINQVTTLEDGRFIVTTYDYGDGSEEAGIYILQERDPEELKNIKLITLATFSMSTNLGRAVNQFNRGNSEYRIGVVDYNKFSTEEDYEAGMNQFNNDMTSGIVADIICVDNISYESFANKGLFLDLSDYVSKLNQDEYFTNYFDALKYGDKLYRLGFGYSVQTLEAKTEHVDGKSGLSIADFTEIIKNLPDGMTAFAEMDRQSLLYNLCVGNLNGFIDVQKATCNFNSPEFVELLEVCASYPEDVNSKMQEWDDEEWTKYWNEQEYQYINDKTLFRNVYVSSIKDQLRERATYFDDADVTWVGYPTVNENSNGGRFQSDYTLAISANSDLKEQAWSFFEAILSEEFQEKLSWSTPVRKEAFDKKAQEALKPDTYVDENGETKEMPYTIYRGNNEIELPLPTQADIDAFKNYIGSITETVYYDEQIYTIIQEESEKFFSGDQTAQAAADMIQSRASLYLSEQS